MHELGGTGEPEAEGYPQGPESEAKTGEHNFLFTLGEPAVARAHKRRAVATMESRRQCCERMILALYRRQTGEDRTAEQAAQA